MGYVYIISNNIDDRVYIGSTISLNKRWNEHKRKLINECHENIHLQRFVNKYGINLLNFNILEEVDNSILLIREQHYIDNTNNKFNISENSSAPMMGRSHTPESIEKISFHSRGINNPMYGKKRPEWLIKMLTTNSIGRPKTNKEKIKRMINLPNRIEVIIKKDDIKIYCFSISHASKLIGVTQQSIASALKSNNKSKGWLIIKSNDNFYDKSFLFKNIDLFDEDCHPQPELIQMLQTLKT